ncbi:methyl-accepting chemotaxis protein [Aliagarivorans taiwanensis]|uniref:methyl-accepting chemotaxis protein n=1 Tax=Aliagarivorans taiwanensis TaxID=561966 RepID=UPI0004161A5F|nr:methyl-accepting chemotaxis protein [Aliagarivorans taiwanensis]
MSRFYYPVLLALLLGSVLLSLSQPLTLVMLPGLAFLWLASRSAPLAPKPVLADTELQRNLEEQADALSEMSHCARELSKHAEQVASGTLQQSQASDSSSAAVLEMSECQSEVARNIEQVASESQQALSIAERGSNASDQAYRATHVLLESSQQTRQQLRQLSQQSSSINSFTETILDLAKQTNLLSLNASIEAARAGDHGRGFAIVAQEVRELAQHCHQAADQIGEHINAQTKQLDATVARFSELDQQVCELQQKIQHSHQLHGEIQQINQLLQQQLEQISVASSQQKLATHSLAEHISEVADAARANMASAEQSADIAQHLRQLSQTEA